MTESTAPAGWYRQGSETERYWDGRAWTDQVRSTGAMPPQAPPYPPAQPAPPSGGYPPYRPPTSGVVMTQYGYMPSVAVAPKSPGIALLASFFIPGLGQLINGDSARGVVMLVGWVVSLVLMVVLIGFLTAFAIWVWSMVDAYQGARTWNAQHGILS